MDKSISKISLSELDNKVINMMIDGHIHISKVNGELVIYSNDSNIGDIILEPEHKHDCDSCVLLDSYYEDGKHYDLYFCKYEGTVIARYGENENYYSGLFSSSDNRHLKRAWKMAENLGFIKEETENLNKDMVDAEEEN